MAEEGGGGDCIRGDAAVSTSRLGCVSAILRVSCIMHMSVLVCVHLCVCVCWSALVFLRLFLSVCGCVCVRVITDLAVLGLDLALCAYIIC